METTEINMAELGDQIVEVIKTIYDPEIPVDIYELGLIYDVFIDEDREVKIIIPYYSSKCPVAESKAIEEENKVQSMKMVKDEEVELTLDHPESQDLMSDEGKLELGML